MGASPWTATTRALFALMVVSWGANYLFVRVGLSYAAPLWLATLRAGVGAMGMAAFLLARRSPVKLDSRARRDALLLGVPNTAVFFGLWFAAARVVPAGQAAVVIYTFPVWVSLLSAPILHRRLSGLHWAAVALGLSGVVLVSEPWASGFSSAVSLALIELAVAPVSWALATVLFERRFRAEELAEVNVYQLVGGASVLLAASLLLEPTDLPTFTPTLWVTILWLGLIGSAFAYAVWFLLLGKIGGPDLSAYLLLVPVTALALSAVFLGERLVPVQGVGVAAVLLSIYVVAKAARGSVVPRTPGRDVTGHRRPAP